MTASTELDNPLPVMLTVVEAARRLSIGRTTVYELLASGALESVHIGRLRRIPVDSLAEFVEACRRQARDGNTSPDSGAAKVGDGAGPTFVTDPKVVTLAAPRAVAGSLQRRRADQYGGI